MENGVRLWYYVHIELKNRMEQVNFGGFILHYKAEKGNKMNRAEFMDRIFDTINESDNLPIQDIIMDAAEDIIKVYLTDGSVFQIQCTKTGYWWLICG